MPTFMDSLAANPSRNPNSGIYGMPGTPNDFDSLQLVNQLKDREMRDFKDKANFMSNLSLTQEQRMRNLFDPNDPKNKNIQDLPHVMAPNPIGQMNEYQKGELSVRNREADLESQRISQQGKLGQEAQDTKSAQEKLNQQKSDQINAEKTADLQRKIEESNKKLELAQQALTDKNSNFEKQLQAHKDLAAAMEKRHKLELTMKDHQFQTTHDQMQQKIDQMEERLKQSGDTTTTTELDPSGNKKTVRTVKGSASANAPTKNPDGSYSVVTPDGRKGTIPADKLNDWMQNHQPGGDQE